MLTSMLLQSPMAHVFKQARAGHDEPAGLISRNMLRRATCVLYHHFGWATCNAVPAAGDVAFCANRRGLQRVSPVDRGCAARASPCEKPSVYRYQL
jgi:hypothetical protein